MEEKDFQAKINFLSGVIRRLKKYPGKWNLGDLVLLRGMNLVRKEREGKIVYAGGILIHKQHSKDLGLALWPPKKLTITTGDGVFFSFLIIFVRFTSPYLIFI